MVFVLDVKILILISAIVNFVLSLFVFIKTKKTKVNISFILFTFFLGLWSLCFYFYFHPIIFSHLIWIKLVYFVSFFIIPPALYFLFNFPVRKVKSFVLPGVIYIICSLILSYFLFFSNLWVREVIVHSWGPETITGNIYFVYFLFVGIITIFTFYSLIKSYLSLKGILKAQLKFILLGIFLFGIPAIIADVVLPLVTGNSSYFWISPLFSLSIVISIAYAITRYRLMDIRLVIGKGLIYFLSFSVIFGFSSSLLFLTNTYAADVSFTITGTLILFISILAFQPVFRVFEIISSKYFYYTFYNYQRVITELAKKLTQILELDKLSSVVIDTLKKTMKLDKAALILKDKEKNYQIKKNIGFKKDNLTNLINYNFLNNFLERTHNPLLSGEITIRITDHQDNKRKLEKLQTEMKKTEATLCLPLFIEERIIGMIILGNKISEEPYSQQDINLLTNLANQASVAIQNARLYFEVRGFSKKLEKEVNKATRELRKAYRDLKKLDEAKSEFISIASHQLRTPLTAIKGYISLINEKIYGRPPKRMKKPLNNIHTSTERLIKLVGDLLNISRIEAGKVKLNIEKSQLEDIINSVVSELKNLAKEKKLYLKWEKPRKSLPKVLVDKDRIRQVILNVIDNGIRYTERGGITIRYRKGNKISKLIISDTGEGMTKKEISNLFRSFTRGSIGQRTWTEGTGLGLYIAKKFLDLHNGKIWAKSPGKGKGSTFYIELPIE